MNFRSHIGILNLANAVIKKMEKCFKDSVEYIEEKGVCKGPFPGWFEVNTNDNELNLLLEKTEKFVILCTQEDRRSQYPNMTIMTIKESKGLEFDDIIILDFFRLLPKKDQDQWSEIFKHDDFPGIRYSIINN